MTTKLSSQALEVSVTDDQGFAGLRYQGNQLQIQKGGNWKTLTPETSAHTVEFVDEDGTILQSSTWAEGETPFFYGDLPEKEGYVFAGWSPAFEKIVKVTYTGHWAEKKNVSFTITQAAEQMDDAVLGIVVLEGDISITAMEYVRSDTEGTVSLKRGTTNFQVNEDQIWINAFKLLFQAKSWNLVFSDESKLYFDIKTTGTYYQES